MNVTTTELHAVKNNNQIIKEALIGAGIGIGGALAFTAVAKGTAAAVAAYGVTKVAVAGTALAATAFGAYKLHQSEQTVALLLKNAQNKFHSKK